MEKDFISRLCRNYHITHAEARSICIEVIKELHKISYQVKEGESFALTLIKTFQQFGDEGCYHWAGLVLKILNKYDDKDSGALWNESVLRFDSSLKRFNSILDEWDWENKDSAKSKPVSHMAEMKSKFTNAYQPWSKEDDEKLKKFFGEKKTIKEISQIFQRNPGAIQSRIKKLELKEKYS